MKIYMDEMTSEEFGEWVSDDKVVIFPIGAVEEHGGHLPLATDSIQPIELAERVARKTGAIIIPPLKYGNCASTADFPGTISIRPETLKAIVVDILKELARHGVRNVLIISGHAGRTHIAAIKNAAGDVVKTENIKVMALSDYDIVYKFRGEEDFPKDDGHAGMIETSRIMAIRPELVKEDRKGDIPDFPPYMVLRDASRYFPTGAMGYPERATADIGKRLNDFLVDEFVKLVDILKRTEM